MVAVFAKHLTHYLCSLHLSSESEDLTTASQRTN